MRLLALLLLLAASASAAQPVPPRPAPADGLVYDAVGLLSPAERAAIDARLVAFADTTTSQIAVVVVPTTGGYAPAEYATALGRAWGVGQAGFDNGVVLLVAFEDRQMFIAVGYGLEGAIPDALAGRIVRDVLRPAFRAERYAEGIGGAVDALIAAASGERFERTRRSEGAFPAPLIVLMVLLVVAGLVLAAHTGTGGGSPPGRTSAAPVRSRSRRRSGIPPVIFLPPPGRSSRGGGGGFGGFGGGSFGGGFGGFGGGSFGGGGAGGSW